MTVVLLGAGPRLVWVRTLLASVSAPPETTPDIRVVEGSPNRDLLVSFDSDKIDTLVLVDHGPFSAGQAAGDHSPSDVVRYEGMRAVFALELARRAARTVVLSEGGDRHAWAASLATLVGAAPLLALPGPLPPWVTGRTIATPLLSGYLEPLFAAVERTGPLTLTWPHESFLDGDAPGKVLPATVEVAGRARILVYGPYLPLPAGSWQATAYLGFSPDIGKMPFILEADTGGAVTRGFFEVERGGIYTLVLDFQVADPLHPVELRLISQDSALEGKLALIEVQLEQR